MSQRVSSRLVEHGWVVQPLPVHLDTDSLRCVRRSYFATGTSTVQGPKIWLDEGIRLGLPVKLRFEAPHCDAFRLSDRFLFHYLDETGYCIESPAEAVCLYMPENWTDEFYESDLSDTDERLLRHIENPQDGSVRSVSEEDRAPVGPLPGLSKLDKNKVKNKKFGPAVAQMVGICKRPSTEYV